MIILRMIVRVLRDIAKFVAFNVVVLAVIFAFIWFLVNYELALEIFGWFLLIATLLVALLFIAIYLTGVYYDVRSRK